MTSTGTRIAENHRNILKRIEAACHRCGRSPSHVTLVAVTKYADITWVRDLASLGIQNFGESRPQQLLERVPQITEPVRWHLIGPLQRNKARRVLPLVSCIHSVDSVRLLAAIDRIAGDLDLHPHLLLEAKVSGEPSKHGFSAADLTADWAMICSFRHVRIRGLMTMAPLRGDPETARPVFRSLRILRDQLVHDSDHLLPELSMGMSNDFEIAVEEGATLVRIGSSLFEGLATK